MHRNSLLIRSNKMQQYAGIYLLQNYSICFGCPLHPSSGVHKTVTVASGTGHSIWVTTFFQRGLIRPRWRNIYIYIHLMLELVYSEIMSEQALNQRPNSPETGKENMQVCPAMTQSRLNTRSPWIQDSVSFVLVSQIFRRLVHAEKQSTICTASAATRHNTVTSEALEYGDLVCNVICVPKSHV